MADPKSIVRRIVQMDMNPVLSWWEKVILFFCRMQKIEGPQGWVEFKHFWDRLYIYRRQLQLPPPAKPQILHVKWDGGANTPWLN